MGPFTQANRFLSLTTPAGKDVLLLNSFTVSERISAPYRIELDVLSDVSKTVDPKTLLGKPVSFSAAYGDLTGGKRQFHGIVSEVVVGGETERFRQYRIVAVPSLWLLGLATHFRVFEAKTVVDIVKEVLGAYSIQTNWRTQGSYPVRDFCFQYEETDLNFISRLMEAEGMFYFFEHSSGSHTMVIGDHAGAHKTCPDQSSLQYAPDIGAGGGDFMTDFELAQELRTGAYESWDWHFEKPSAPFTATSNTPSAVGGTGSYSLREYLAGGSAEFNNINGVSKLSQNHQRLAKLRMQEIESMNPVYRGTSTARAFSAGQKFTLQGGDKPGEYVITRIEHSGAQYPPYTSGLESPMLYTNSLECIKSSQVYRPPRTADRALVPGPQTALVTEGPDKYGRMRVKFHWGGQVASGWVRVLQRWAGTTWGTIFLPRIDHEVVIEFVNGDPDHPLIMGSVYNSNNMPPYSLPGNYTQSGIKTRSMTSDGKTQGGSDEFNELRFEDKQGSEDIYFHAQKDFHRVVENDDDLKVGHDQTIEIKNHRTETVKDGNEKVTIEKGNREIYVNTGNDKHQVKMGNREAIIDMGNDTLTVKMGNHIRKINLGKSETEAMQSITLKVGVNKIVVDQTGITLDGIMINFKGSAMIKSQAPMQQMNGDAMVMIKGGITMIN